MARLLHTFPKASASCCLPWDPTLSHTRARIPVSQDFPLSFPTLPLLGASWRPSPHLRTITISGSVLPAERLPFLPESICRNFGHCTSTVCARAAEGQQLMLSQSPSQPAEKTGWGGARAEASHHPLTPVPITHQHRDLRLSGAGPWMERRLLHTPGKSSTSGIFLQLLFHPHSSLNPSQ